MKFFISIILFFAIGYGVIGFFCQIATNQENHQKGTAEEEPYEEETEGGLRYSDVPVYKDKHTSSLAYVEKQTKLSEHELCPTPDACFTRNYTVSDDTGRGYLFSYRIPKKDVEDDIRKFGYSRDELFTLIQNIVVRYNRKYDGKLRITLHSDLTYEYDYRSGYRYLHKQFQEEYYTAKREYFESHMRVHKNDGWWVNYPAVQIWREGFFHALYNKLILFAEKQGMNQKDFVKMLASFVQHLAYRVPSDLSGRNFWGFWPPIICLKEKAGDCDSKSTLFASIFYHYRKNSCILLLTKRHAFIGIRNMHRNYPLDYTLRIGGVDYILLETTSLRRLGYIDRKSLENLRQRQFSYILFH